MDFTRSIIYSMVHIATTTLTIAPAIQTHPILTEEFARSSPPSTSSESAYVSGPSRGVLSMALPLFLRRVGTLDVNGEPVGLGDGAKEGPPDADGARDG